MNRGYYRGGKNFRGNARQPFYHESRYARPPMRKQRVQNQDNSINNFAHKSNPNVTKKVELEESTKILKDISMLPYLERRGLKGLLSGNPRFHLVAFNGVPKYIKLSMFLADMCTNIPEIKSKMIISVHTAISSSNRDLVDYQIGFNSLKVIKRLEEILGTGYVELYKGNVQIVIPDIEAYSNCEYNKVVTDEMTQTKQPFKLMHKDMCVLNVIEMLEKICGEKIHFVSALCCTGEISYITVDHSALVINLNAAAESYKYKLEQSETIAMTGIIPSSLLPQETQNTPLNASQTSKLTSEEIVKFNGFKKIFDQFAKQTKNEELNLLKRSLRESQNAIENSLSNNEKRISEKIFPLETKINAVYARLETIELKMHEMEQSITKAVSSGTTKAPGIKKANSTSTRSSQRQLTNTSSVSPSTYGVTEKTAIEGDGHQWENLEDEIDNTK